MSHPASRPTLLLAALALVFALTLLPGFGAMVVFAQDAPAVDTPTPEPTATPTNTPTPDPTATPTNTPTPDPTATATPTPTPSTDPTPVPTPAPVPIPEPITTVLFGTGLAALAGAVAARRRNKK